MYGLFDPYACLLFLIGGSILLYIVYRVRLNLARRDLFSNESYQLGIIFGTVCMMLTFGLIGTLLFLTS